MYSLLFPFLLCTLPLNAVFAQNTAEISIKDYTLSFFILILIITVGIFGLNAFLNNLYLSELIFCLNFFLFINANIFFIKLFRAYKRELLKYQIIFCIIFLALCVMLSYIIILLLNKDSAIFFSKVLFCISLFVNFFIYLDIIKKINNFYKNVNKTQEEELSLPDFPTDLPDIYHIITDSHTGFDRPEYCDNFFKKELIKRGFKIYPNAKSNYNYTHCSVPSILNMDYIENITGSISNSETLKYYGNNKVFKVLEKAGYNITASTFTLYKHLLKNSHNITITTFKTFISNSLLHIFLQIKKISLLNSNLKEIKNTIIAAAQDDNTTPKYYFGHLLAPHYPYLKTEDGTTIKYSDRQNLKLYFTYQKYINKQLLTIIDELKTKIKPDSIIIIHGDHSVDGAYDALFKTLLAIYIPEKYNPDFLPPNCTLVNLFRGLFNEVLKTNYPLLENKFRKVLPKENNNIDDKLIKQLYYLKRKYNNKRVVLYGIGKFFNLIQNNYNLNQFFNIAGISDIKYSNITQPQQDKTTGYDIISPDFIYKLKPDIVIITTLEPYYAEKYFNEILFQNKNNRFKYDILKKDCVQSVLDRQFI